MLHTLTIRQTIHFLLLPMCSYVKCSVCFIYVYAIFMSLFAKRFRYLISIY